MTRFGFPLGFQRRIFRFGTGGFEGDDMRLFIAIGIEFPFGVIVVTGSGARALVAMEGGGAREGAGSAAALTVRPFGVRLSRHGFVIDLCGGERGWCVSMRRRIDVVRFVSFVTI